MMAQCARRQRCARDLRCVRCTIEPRYDDAIDVSEAEAVDQIVELAESEQMAAAVNATMNDANGDVNDENVCCHDDSLLLNSAAAAVAILLVAEFAPHLSYYSNSIAV